MSHVAQLHTNAGKRAFIGSASHRIRSHAISRCVSNAACSGMSCFEEEKQKKSWNFTNNQNIYGPKQIYKMRHNVHSFEWNSMSKKCLVKREICEFQARMSISHAIFTLSRRKNSLRWSHLRNIIRELGNLREVNLEMSLSASNNFSRDMSNSSSSRSNTRKR